MPARWIEHLYAALASDYGIVVTVDNNPGLARQILYRARREDPEFERLAIIPSPITPDTDIWIVRKPDAQIDPPAAEGDT